jgi:hypothetical protein
MHGVEIRKSRKEEIIMKTNFYLSRICRAALALTAMLLAGFSEAVAGGKAGLHGIRMVPRGEDAKNFNRAGYGLGATSWFRFRNC